MSVEIEGLRTSASMDADEGRGIATASVGRGMTAVDQTNFHLHPTRHPLSNHPVHIGRGLNLKYLDELCAPQVTKATLSLQYQMLVSPVMDSCFF
jgi:hypothetical protein